MICTLKFTVVGFNDGEMYVYSLQFCFDTLQCVVCVISTVLFVHTGD